MSGESVYRLALKPALDDVTLASDWLHGIAAVEALPQKLLFRIDLCLAEAVTNVISYGEVGCADGPVRLELRLDADLAELLVEDSGVAFNPLEAPEREQPASLAEAPIGGLGIHLIRQYADQCVYERRDGLNRLRLRWHRAILTAPG